MRVDGESRSNHSNITPRIFQAGSVISTYELASRSGGDPCTSLAIEICLVGRLQCEEGYMT